jgi:hypothetical protein
MDRAERVQEPLCRHGFKDHAPLLGFDQPNVTCLGERRCRIVLRDHVAKVSQSVGLHCRRHWNNAEFGRQLADSHREFLALAVTTMFGTYVPILSG